MSATPIFDELYAKYLVGGPANGVTMTAPRAEAGMTAPREPLHDDRASEYAGRHQVPQWPT
ncbi:hypothetical protein [Lentzea sp. E54]|uniref:hypothetical protein n=1 Tax=Lentzea xerophila TaxID=3435883 RepID=UPI003DA373D5